MRYLFVIWLLCAASAYGQEATPFIYFLHSKQPTVECEFIGDKEQQEETSWVKGRVYIEGDTADCIITADVKLLLEIDGILYETSNSCLTDIDNRFCIGYPSHMDNNRHIKKFLKIERTDMEPMLISIGNHSPETPLEVYLKRTTPSFPSIIFRNGNFYVDFSVLDNLDMQNGEFPVPYGGSYSVFYESLCRLLHGSEAWEKTSEAEFLIEFDIEGCVENVETNLPDSTLTDYITQKKWSPARFPYGRKTPMRMRLRVEKEK